MRINPSFCLQGSKCQGFFPSACCDAVSQTGSVPTPGVRVPAGSLPELPARQGSAVGGPGGER